MSNKRILWREAFLSAVIVLPWFIYAFGRYGSILPHSALAKINQNQYMVVGGDKGFSEQLLLHLTDGPPFEAVCLACHSLRAYMLSFDMLENGGGFHAGLCYTSGLTLDCRSHRFLDFVPALVGILLICAIDWAFAR